MNKLIMYKSRVTNLLYAVYKDTVIMFKNNRWSSCIDTTAHQIRNNSNFKELL